MENYALSFATFSFHGDFKGVVPTVLVKIEVITPGAFDCDLRSKQMGRINDRGMRVNPSEARSSAPLHSRKHHRS